MNAELMNAELMSQQRRDFSEVWTELAPRLQRVLRARRVPRDVVDDLVQEVGMRLYRKWDQVDPTGVWSLADAILGNLVRDEMRKQAVRERRASEERAEIDNFEEAVIHRLELQQVEKVMKTLPVLDQQILLAECGEGPRIELRSPAALKMARMRARRRLRAALENTSCLAPLWRLRDAFFGKSRAMMVLAEHIPQIAAIVVFAAALGVVTSSPEERALRKPNANLDVGMNEVANSAAAPGIEGKHTWVHPPNSGRSRVARDVNTFPVPSGHPASGRNQMNENFGPLRNDDGDIYIGEGGNGFGPYGVDKGAETSPGGKRVGGRARARYEAPKCEGDVIIGGETTYRCDGPGSASASAEAEADGKEHRTKNETP